MEEDGKRYGQENPGFLTQDNSLESGAVQENIETGAGMITSANILSSDEENSGDNASAEKSASVARSRFGFGNRRYDASRSQQNNQMTFNGAPSFFNESAQRMALEQKKPSNRKMMFILGGAIAAVVVIAIVIVTIMAGGKNDGLLGSNELKSKFYSFANYYLHCKDEDKALTEKYDESKAYCAGGSIRDKEYRATLKEKYGSFYEKYVSEKEGNEAYQDIMLEFNDYMNFLQVWGERKDITETEFSNYYFANGREEAIKHFDSVIDSWMTGDYSKISSYREFAKDSILKYADMYDIYNANCKKMITGIAIGQCASTLNAVNSAKINELVNGINDDMKAMKSIENGAFAYVSNKIFEISNIMERGENK